MLGSPFANTGLPQTTPKAIGKLAANRQNDLENRFDLSWELLRIYLMFVLIPAPDAECLYVVVNS